ncbi:MAG TPA: hypothetical protein ENN29_02005, partial [Candidatus Hydrogenedentes bacterium]|nr:hypothetical protein [Candidatus Hydrogenedentota bacterium]
PPPRPQIAFVTPGATWLDRETRWHSYYLQANAIYQEFAKCHIVDQGSAYSALHGAMGAHRDFALFALPLVYLRSDLARDILRFSMTSQDKRTGALPYAHIGYGKQSGAGLHASSSDLDLFFLWAAAEYLRATRDFSLLEEAVPYHPASAGIAANGLEHLRAAFNHLQHRVGVGKHGLLRCGTGDWNDALIGFSKRKLATIRKGESLLNAGLAAMALPKLADALAAHAPEFAEQLRRFADEQAHAAKQLWAGRWWARGYLGIGNRVLGHDRLFLDCQAFPTLAGLLAPSEQKELLAAIQECCIAPQPWGATALSPPMRGLFLQPGADTNGGVWAAVDAWTVWAMAIMDARAGWDFFLRTTMKQRTEAYPDLWYGIWSGPDACNAQCHTRPGETYNHVVTPMTDFPVMNANYHAGPLLDIIKLAGIEPHGDALRIAPKLPFDSFVFRSPLVGVAYLPDACRGYYTPVADGRFTFEVQLPKAMETAEAQLYVNDESVTGEVHNGRIRFSTDRCCGQRICWEIHQTAFNTAVTV